MPQARTDDGRRHDGGRQSRGLLKFNSRLKFICQSLANSESLLMSFCKMSSSSGLVICLYNRESSAKRRSFELIFLCMSLIYTRKNNGPRTVPCGTPDVTAASLE